MTRTVAGLRLAVVHETGAAAGRERRAARRHPDVGLLLFGHSHLPWDTTAEDGRLRLLNPGSPTEPRRQPSGTFLVVTVEGPDPVADVRAELRRVTRT